MKQREEVTVLGLGTMGSALSLTSPEVGLKTHVWNRTASRLRVKTVVSHGGELEETVACAFQSSPLIVICLFDYASIYENVASLPAERFTSKTIVNLTNGTPNEARQISGGENEEAFEQVSSRLSIIGRLEYLGTDPGAAALHDSALLAGMWGMFGGSLTAIALLSKATLSKDPTPTSKVIAERFVPMLQALLPMLVTTAEKFDRKDWTGRSENNAVQVAGMRNLVRTCEAEGVHSRLLRGLWELFDWVVRGGRGKEGMTGLVRDLVGEK